MLAEVGSMHTKRRNFLRLSAMTALSYSRILGANERLRLGAIGVGERGRSDMGKFQGTGQVDVAAVCDIYAEQIDKAKSAAPQATTFTDHRKLLEKQDLDIVLIATPDHWHSAVTIDALNAGKD